MDGLGFWLFMSVVIVLWYFEDKQKAQRKHEMEKLKHEKKP